MPNFESTRNTEFLRNSNTRRSFGTLFWAIYHLTKDKRYHRYNKALIVSSTYLDSFCILPYMSRDAIMIYYKCLIIEKGLYSWNFEIKIIYNVFFDMHQNYYAPSKRIEGFTGSWKTSRTFFIVFVITKILISIIILGGVIFKALCSAKMFF